MKKLQIVTVGALFFALAILFLSSESPIAQAVGGSGTINQLDQWRSTSSPFTAITTNQAGANLYLPSTNATASSITASTFCLINSTCISSWLSGGGGGGSATYIQNGGATLNSGTTTLNFTPKSFSVTDRGGGLFDIRVATTTLGLLASSISDFVSTVRSSITESVAGLTFTSGDLSLDSGYVVPTTTREVNQDTAFSWGNHATQGYLTGNQTITLTGGVTGSGATSIATVISSSTVRGMLSNSATGLTYTPATGDTALTSGYAIPTTTRMSLWDAKGNGTVTSVDMSVPTGLSIAGNPITNSGTLALSLTSGYVIPSTTRATAWDTASGTVTSVAMSVPTGLQITGSPVTTSGTLALSYASGYIPLLDSASTSLFSFYNTPSNRITAGTGLSWSGNTLNSTGGGSGSIGTSSPFVAGQVLYATGVSTTATVATGTLTENVNGLNFSATGNLIGSSAILQVDAGFSLASTSDFSRINTAFASSTAINATTPITYNGNTGNISIQAGSGSQNGYISSADWNVFNQKVSSSSIDTLGELETLQGGINIIQSTEINTSALLAGLLSDETGSTNGGLAVFSNAPAFLGTATFNALSVTNTSTLGYASSTSFTTGNAYITNDTISNATATNLYVSGQTRIASLNGLLKGTTGVLSTASNGTDFTLVTANTCSAGSHFSQVTASGVFTCSADSGGGGGAPSNVWATTTTTNTTVGENVTYVSTDVFIGGSAPTTTVFNFDKDSSTFTISSTTAVNATGTIYSMAGSIALGTTTESVEFNLNTADTLKLFSNTGVNKFDAGLLTIIGQNASVTNSTSTYQYAVNEVNVNATTTNLGVTSLTQASCDVKATTNGSLYCGTDATGGGGGSQDWVKNAILSALSPSTTIGIVINASSTFNGALTVASSSYNFTDPLFEVSTSTDTFGSLFSIFSTTTLTANATGTNAFTNGVRVLVGLVPAYYSGSNPQSQLYVNGAIDSSFDYVFCDAGTVTVAPTADIQGACGNASYQEDATGATGALTTVTYGSETISSISFSDATANSGAGIFLNYRSILMGTSSPIYKGTVYTVQNATNSVAYSGFFDTNPTSATFEVSPPNGAYFTASSSQGTWLFVLKRNNTIQTSVDTGVASTSILFHTIAVDSQNIYVWYGTATAKEKLLTVVVNPLGTIGQALSAGAYYGQTLAHTAGQNVFGVIRAELWKKKPYMLLNY